MAEIRVRFEDILEGRAYLRIPFAGKVILAHMAGAPWADKAPDACLHGAQVEILSRRERTKVCHGGSRFGKSVLAACEGIVDLMLYLSRIAVIAARYDHVNAEFEYIARGMRTIFRNHPAVFKTFLHVHKPSNYRYMIETVWGASCQGFSTDADDGAALLGKEFSRAILGEGSHIDTEIYEKRIARAVDGWLMQSTGGMVRPGGWVSIYTTPKEYGGCSASLWERVHRETKREPEKRHFGAVPFQRTTYLREADVLENPYFDRQVYEERRATLDRAAFEETYQGKMTYRTGRIYKEFSEERHVFETFPKAEWMRQMRWGVGIDTGTYFAASLVGLDREGILWNVAEVYGEQRTIIEDCEEVKQMVSEVLGRTFGTEDFDLLKDRIEFWITDPASQHKIEISELLDLGVSDPIPLDMQDGKFHQEPTIEAVRDLFKGNRIRIHEDCVYTVDQLRKYVWKQQKVAGSVGSKAPVVVVPKKGYDHLCDSLRFITLSLVSFGPAEEEADPVSVQEAWEQHQRDCLHGPLRDLKRRANEQGPVWI